MIKIYCHQGAFDGIYFQTARTCNPNNAPGQLLRTQMIKRVLSFALTSSLVILTVTIASAASSKTPVQKGPEIAAVVGMGALPDAGTLKMLVSSSVLGSLYLVSRRRK